MSDYIRKYTNGINWQNYTNITTPLSASNLNGMVQGINDVDAEAARAIATKADKEETKYHVKGVSFDGETGIFTFTLQNNSTITIDTALEKVVTNFVYNYETEMLVLTLADGTTQNVDLSKLITQYEFRNSPFIAFIMGTGSGGRNKLQITTTGTTTNGITYTVNADGTVTANGTATADSEFALSAAFATTAESVLSGCPDGGGSSTYFIAYGSYSDEGETVTIDSGESEIPTITIKSGVEVDNLVFKPMISLKTDYDVSPDFIPYLKAGEVYATLKKGSITGDYLQPDYLADVTGQKNLAIAAATLAESYAHGGTGTRTGENTDNAMAYARDSEAWAVEKRGGTDVGITDPTYHNSAKYHARQAEIAAETATSVITDFTGATASADGTHGLVPKPLQDANPEKKVLRADGQWGTIEAVPNGGTTGQLLAKRSNTDGDAEWVDGETPIGYGTCTTAADQQIKVVTIADPNWKLKVGSIIGVKFVNSNTYSSTAENPVKLNVNSTGDKQVYYDTTLSPTGTSQLNYGVANRIIYYMYDGTYWVWLSNSRDANDNTVPAAYCTTSAGTSDKTATHTKFVLKNKCYELVTIQNSNTVQKKLTLNINSTGAKDIWINGAVSSSSNYTLPAGTYFVYYDDNKYYFRTDGIIPGLENVVCAATVGGAAPSIQDPYLKQSDVDDSLSSQSENPVQNKVVKAAVDGIEEAVEGIETVVDELKGRFDYSTTEKVVGKWIDNKPIYQKTITGTLAGTASVSSNDYTYVLSLDNNIEYCISVEGFIDQDNHDYQFPFNSERGASSGYAKAYYKTSDKTLRFAYFIWFHNQPYYLTLWYTKTTD